mgnify:CR=1 FL=1
MKIRAIRKQTYFKKVKNKQQDLLNLSSTFGKKSMQYVKESIKFKQLFIGTPDYIEFEELLVHNPFSDDELINGGNVQQDFDKQMELKKTIHNVTDIESKSLKIKECVFKSMNCFIRAMDQVNLES